MRLAWMKKYEFFFRAEFLQYTANQKYIFGSPLTDTKDSTKRRKKARPGNKMRLAGCNSRSRLNANGRTDGRTDPHMEMRGRI